MKEPYGIGLDIGTSSVGWTVVDDKGHLKKVKGKTAIGARLFSEGEAAAERRGFRTTRRRLKRRKWRLRLLREFFDEPISEIDADFFARRKYASVSPRDPKYNGQAKTLFNDRTDKEFYEKYPTIYHLRHALMTENRKFDLREIYLAMHHIIKSRGNFLSEGPATNYQSTNLDLKTDFEQLNSLWSQLDDSLGLAITTDGEQLNKIKAILVRNDLSRSDQQKQIIPLLYRETESNGVAKNRRKAVVTELAKALVGNKAKVNVLTLTEIDAEEQKNWSFDMGNSQDSMPLIEDGLSLSAQDIMTIVIKLYSAINLSQLIPEGKSFSESMIDKYNQHAADLKLLKAYLNTQTDVERKHAIRATYDHYISGIAGKAMPQENFYKELNKFVESDKSTNSSAEKIYQSIQAETYMPKLRTKQNGVIPYQVQQNELDQIINRQKQYYPWLGESNPVMKRRGKFPYKLDELIGFRIPYYTGPLVTQESQNTHSNANFAWMVRKADGQITPWNFDEKVDREASANAFIQRMRTTDTYLVGEDVLPLQSLIYQRFMVLNELNKIKIDGEWITVKQKQRLYEQVFKKQKQVSVKQIKRNLVCAGDCKVEPQITGLADPKKFNSSLSTYYDLNKIVPDALMDSNRQGDIEKIILWSTVFEDKSIFKAKLEELTWLTEQQRDRLIHLRYRGWGRLSKKLLVTFKDENGRSILDALWATNHNFMELQSQEVIARQITTANAAGLNEADIQDTINDLYTSPQNKKAIREVMLVLADIQNAMHGQAPSKVYVEAARGGGQSGQRTQTRSQQIKNAYQTTAKEIVSETVKDEFQKRFKTHERLTDWLVLYFMQNGRDLYTGKTINIDRPSLYQIDHILPQSLIKDDSLDNRVLTSAPINAEKNDIFASEKFGMTMGNDWRRLHQAGLISGRKLRNLTMRRDEISKFAVGFVHRQLVETRQVIKLITDLIDASYPETTIVSVKANLTHQFRRTFNFPKNRDVNNYHHAFDAYLTALIGNYLLRRYPKLERFFVYGKFKKLPVTMTHFNFINQLKNATSPIIDSETGEILWDKDKGLAELIQIYNFKRILVNREVRENNAGMFKQTLFKATDADSKKLVSKKDGLDPTIYGGYTKKQTAYLAIVKVSKKGTFEYKVISVATLQRVKIERLVCNGLSEKEALHRILEPQFTRIMKKTGKIKYDPFEVILPKVRLDQVIRDEFKGGVHRFALGSDTLYHNIQELILPLSMQRKLVKRNVSASDLDEVFDATLDQVTKYFQIYDNRSFREKLLGKDDMFKRITDTGEKRLILDQLFTGLHANSTFGNLQNLGLGTGFGELKLSGGIKLTQNAEIIYQSPTGLFERRVVLKDL